MMIDTPARWAKVYATSIISILFIGSLIPGMFVLSMIGYITFVLSNYEEMPRNEFVVSR